MIPLLAYSLGVLTPLAAAIALAIWLRHQRTMFRNPCSWPDWQDDPIPSSLSGGSRLDKSVEG